MDRSPTPLQREAWSTLSRMTMEAKRPPSIRELMTETGQRSTSTMVSRLERGVKAGMVIKVPGAFGAQYAPAWWGRMIEDNIERYYE